MSVHHLPLQSHSMACSRMKPLWLARRCYSAAMPAWRPASALSASATSPQPTAAAHAAHSQHTVTHSSPALSARYIIPSRSVSWGTTQRIPKGRNHSCAAGSPVVAAATAEAAPQEQQSAPEKVAPISLPTSDESDDLLRIRHSVSPTHLLIVPFTMARLALAPHCRCRGGSHTAAAAQWSSCSQLLCLRN